MSESINACYLCSSEGKIFRNFASGGVESNVAIICTGETCDVSVSTSDFDEALDKWNNQQFIKIVTGVDFLDFWNKINPVEVIRYGW